MEQYRTLEVGSALAPVAKEITLAVIEGYAEVSGDRNPLHALSEVADRSLLRGVAAHGMITVALVSQMMAATFEENWLTDGEVEIDFRAPVRPGDRVKVTGTIAEVTPRNDDVLYVCEVACRTQDDELVASGRTRVLVRGRRPE